MTLDLIWFSLIGNQLFYTKRDPKHAKLLIWIKRIINTVTFREYFKYANYLQKISPTIWRKVAYHENASPVFEIVGLLSIPLTWYRPSPLAKLIGGEILNHHQSIYKGKAL